MRHSLLTTLLVFVTVQIGCTTIPGRFNTMDSIVPGCGYVVEGESSSDFSLEVAYKEYKFFPSSDPVIVSARACFVRVAAELAKREGKSIAPLTAADMSATVNRNIVDAQYLVHVTGRIRFAAQ